MWKGLFLEFEKWGLIDAVNAILIMVGKALSNRKVLKHFLKVIQILLSIFQLYISLLKRSH